MEKGEKVDNKRKKEESINPTTATNITSSIQGFLNCANNNPTTTSLNCCNNSIDTTCSSIKNNNSEEKKTNKSSSTTTTTIKTITTSPLENSSNLFYQNPFQNPFFNQLIITNNSYSNSTSTTTTKTNNSIDKMSEEGKTNLSDTNQQPRMKSSVSLSHISFHSISDDEGDEEEEYSKTDINEEDNDLNSKKKRKINDEEEIIFETPTVTMKELLNNYNLTINDVPSTILHQCNKLYLQEKQNLQQENNLQNNFNEYFLQQKATQFLLTAEQIQNISHKMKMLYGLELDFGTALFYHIWEESQKLNYVKCFNFLFPKEYFNILNNYQSINHKIKNYNFTINNNINDNTYLNILTDKELQRVSQFVIQSKQAKANQLLSCSVLQWSEEVDVMSSFSIHSTQSFTSLGSMKSINLDNKDVNNITFGVSDEDPNDLEMFQLKQLNLHELSFENEVYRINRWKTEGAFIYKLKIGDYIPKSFYDGQFRIKCSPLLKKLYYKFFTFIPKDLNSKEMLEVLQNEKCLHPTLRNNLAFMEDKNNLFYNFEMLFLRELDKYKVSSCLKIEIAFDIICGIHLQKLNNNVTNNLNNNKSNNNNNLNYNNHPDLALLVLKLKSPPKFFKRRIMCTNHKLNELSTCKDFTRDNVASTVGTHYIIGEERELKRIVALMIEADKEVGHIEKVFKEGINNNNEIYFDRNNSEEGNNSPKEEFEYEKKEDSKPILPQKYAFESIFFNEEDEKICNSSNNKDNNALHNLILEDKDVNNNDKEGDSSSTIDDKNYNLNNYCKIQ
ncbi:hypothetical protein ABK040_013127 [Willaertia magna]